MYLATISVLCSHLRDGSSSVPSLEQLEAWINPFIGTRFSRARDEESLSADCPRPTPLVAKRRVTLEGGGLGTHERRQLGILGQFRS